jgi:dihydrofolate reductase
VLLLGRETYDSFAGAWPDREAAGGDDAPFAKRLGDTRKVVASRQPRVIYAPTEAPAKVGHDEVKDQVPDGR